MIEIQRYIAQLAEGKHLDEEQATRAFQIIMSGGATPAHISAILMGLRILGETPDEMVGAAKVLRARALKIKAPPGAMDVCGTGGDGSNTYNISSAVAMVVAACGVPVAKHGNKGVSSRSGSADVLKALGVNLDAPMSSEETCLKETGLCFMMAPRHHKSMIHVGTVRQELGIRTIFNLVGPLSNPAEVTRQLVGVYSRDWVEPMAESLRRLGTEKAWVVHGSFRENGGLDELSTTGVSYVAEVTQQGIHTFEVTPEDAGLPFSDPDMLIGGSADKNARAMSVLLNGRKQPSLFESFHPEAAQESEDQMRETTEEAYRNIVLFNAAAALVVADKARDLRHGVELAADALDSQKAKEMLAQLVFYTSEKVE